MDVFFQPKFFEIPLPNLDEPKTVLHFSDLHLSLSDEESNGEERILAESGSANWEKIRLYFAQKAGESCEDIHLLAAEKIAEKYSELAREIGADAVLCTGDLWDDYYPANVRFTKAWLKTFPVPFLWCKGNHETGDFPEYNEFMNGDPSFQTLPLGNLKLIAIDDSRKTVTQKQLERIKEELSDGCAPVLCYHVPLRTSFNEEALKEKGEYYSIAHGDGGEKTEDFLQWMISKECPLTLTLAGHLHAPSDTKISEKCRQIVVSSALVGNVNIYRFVPEK